MPECIFCKIASKGINADIVHETDKLVVIRDIDPQAPTHLLILPKKHYATLLDCDDSSLLGEMLSTAALVAKKLDFSGAGFRTVVNTNEEGGQSVFHLHMHVLAGRPLSGRMG